jgi:hypothetical protein
MLLPEAAADRSRLLTCRLPTSTLNTALVRSSLLQLQGIHTSSWLSAINIVCPPMGDSVSEGSIAAVLKQPGREMANPSLRRAPLLYVYWQVLRDSYRAVVLLR